MILAVKSDFTEGIHLHRLRFRPPVHLVEVMRRLVAKQGPGEPHLPMLAAKVAGAVVHVQVLGEFRRNDPAQLSGKQNSLDLFGGNAMPCIKRW